MAKEFHNHVVSLNFEVLSEEDEPSDIEIKIGLFRRLILLLNEGENAFYEATECYDSYLEEGYICEGAKRWLGQAIKLGESGDFLAKIFLSCVKEDKPEWFMS